MTTIKTHARRLCVSLAAALLVASMPAAASAQAPELVSVGAAAQLGDADSGIARISADGRFVAFQSACDQSRPRRHQRRRRHLRARPPAGTRPSASASTARAVGDRPTLSAPHLRRRALRRLRPPERTSCRGRHDASADVFVHDRQTGTTERVSVHSAGRSAERRQRRARHPSRRRPLRRVRQPATNLVPGTPTTEDVFVRDLLLGPPIAPASRARRVARKRASQLVSICANGRYVAFARRDQPRAGRHERRAGRLRARPRRGGDGRVSVGSRAAQGNGDSPSASISADGRLVAFASAHEPRARDTNGLPADVFVRDRTAAGTERERRQRGRAGQRRRLWRGDQRRRPRRRVLLRRVQPGVRTPMASSTPSFAIVSARLPSGST